MKKGTRSTQFLLIKCLFALITAVFLSNFLGSSPSEPSNIDSDLERQKNAEMVKERVQNYHAQRAAERSSVCPKLVQREVDNDLIQRTQEVMSGDYCDYFLYPNEKQTISVSTDNDDLKVSLIVPRLYDFANGDYQVKSYDKHVIRVAYDGLSYRPENIVYDVNIRVQNQRTTF